MAVTVPDLEEAVRFFVEALGASLLYIEELAGDGAWLRENLAVSPDARLRIALLRLGPTMNLELFQYTVRDQVTAPPRNSDIGGHHLAFVVDDIDAAYGYIRELAGVTCQGSPKLISTGPLAGSQWVYFTTPWGLQLELTSPPAHLPYETATRERRFGPHHGSWDDAHAR